MLKHYIWRDTEWQFEEGEQPDGAVEVKTKAAAPPETKAKKPANKARKAATK